MTYVREEKGLFVVMIKSSGLLGDYAIKKCRSRSVAENYSEKINRKLKKVAMKLENR